MSMREENLLHVTKFVYTLLPCFNHEKAIQEFESHCRDGKEIHGGNCLTMIGVIGWPIVDPFNR